MIRFFAATGFKKTRPSWCNTSCRASARHSRPGTGALKKIPRCLRHRTQAGTPAPGKNIFHSALFTLLSALAVLLLLHVPSAFAARDIYKDMLDLTRTQLLIDDKGNPKLDFGVKRFTAKVISDQDTQFHRYEVLEAFDPLKMPNIFTRRNISWGVGAFSYAGPMQSIARREEQVKALGRDLQLIATSYEAPILSPDYGDFPEKARAVIRIWQAGSGSAVRTNTGLMLRSAPMDARPGDQQVIKGVGDRLQELVKKDDFGDEDREAFIAAVWRYSYGLLFTKGVYETPPPILEAEPGTERQFLAKVFPTLEQALEELRTNVVSLAPLDDMKNKEIVWFTMQEKNRDRLLPKNVRIWAYVQKHITDGFTHISGDVGLQWVIGTEPVLPSLCKDTNGAIETSPTQNLCDTGNPTTGPTTLGGAFPPPPVDGTGLCAQPLQKLGYLCRPITGDAGTTICKDTVKPIAGQITLSACTKDTGTRSTLMGPDACEDLQWKDSVAFDPQSQCKAKLSCKSLSFGGAKQEAKQADGTMELIIEKDPAKLEKFGAPPVALMIHEITHMQQNCAMPPGYWPYPKDTSKMKPENFQHKCCTYEGEAYKRQCEAYEQDGMLRSKNGAPVRIRIGTQEVELNVETCWQILTDASCRQRSALPASTGGIGKEIQCPAAFTFANKDSKAVIQTALTDMTKMLFKRAKELKLPVTCDEVLNNPKGMDSRIAAAIRDVDKTNRQVCDPNRTTGYINTIGGNVCYMNQCLEQSVEEHRLIPGRMTLSANETNYPFEGCVPPGPDDSTLTTVALTTSRPLPAYRPEYLVQSLDTALCQLNGLPPSTPPFACGFSAERPLRQLDDDILKSATNLWLQPQALRAAVDGTQSLSDALGARVASELYKEYLDSSLQKLAGVTAEASALLRQFTAVNFSPAMCPFKDDGTWLYSQPICK